MRAATARRPAHAHAMRARLAQPPMANTTADLLVSLAEEHVSDLPGPLACPAGERLLASLWAGYGRVTELEVIAGGTR